MFKFLFVFFCFFGLVLVWHFATRKYLNPYKLIFLVAKKGGGKTSTLTKFALRHLSRGWTVYCTFSVPGTYFIDYSDVGPYEFPKRSLIVIDEAGMVWDNRDFKHFSKEVRDWFKLQRHRHCKVIMASQDFDVDLKLRKLCDEMYLLSSCLRTFSYGKRVLRKISIVEATGDANSESRLVDQLYFDSFLFFWCGARTFTFIPRYVRYFDSFEAPPLKVKEFTYVPPLDEDEVFWLRCFRNLRSFIIEKFKDHRRR